MRTTLLRYGLIGSAVWCVIFFGSFVLVKLGVIQSFDYAEIIGYSGIILSLSMIYFALVHQRDRVNGGHLSFGQGFVLGLLITLLVATVVAGTDVLHVFVIDPGFIQAYMEHYKAKQLAAGVSEEALASELARMNQEYAMIQTPLGTFAVMFLTVLPIGLLVSLVSALLLKRRAVPIGG